MPKKKTPTKKKQTRRSKQENPDLDPRFNLKTRTDLLDQDYLHKLDKKTLAWLNKFNKESINASFDSENPRKNLHRSKKLRKECYDRNNARNRDVLTRAKASNQLTDYDTLIDNPEKDNVEDFLIQKLDEKEAIEAVNWLAQELDKDDENIEQKLINELEAIRKKE